VGALFKCDLPFIGVGVPDYDNDNRFADNDKMSGNETRPTGNIKFLIGDPSNSRATVVYHLHHRAAVPPTPTRAAGATGH